VRLGEAVDRASAVLDKLGLGSKCRDYPRILSGGQQQRVALARALVHEPRLIICDEPTAALDHKTGETVMELLAGSALHPGRAVLVVTHDSRVYHFAHRIAHMDDGIITATTVPSSSSSSSSSTSTSSNHSPIPAPAHLP
jgi:putative ABC transport system ATP-binding protein